jgi:hypothetical protein
MPTLPVHPSLDQLRHQVAFCQASVNGRMRLAARMLEASPELAGYSFATAAVLGDATRVAEGLRRDPSLATRTDLRWGWSPLHLACTSRWYQLEPARADGLTAVARLLLDAGGAAVGSGEQPTSNPAPDWIATVQTLLDHGASTDAITLSPDDAKPPSADVAMLLRERVDARRQ